MTHITQKDAYMYVNIGDNTTFGRYVNRQELEEALRYLDIKVASIEHIFGGERSEGTYVVRLDGIYAKPVMRDLSLLLQQDCVAVLFRQKGYLAGLKADAWGPFQPELFMMAEGVPLSEVPA